MGIKVIHDSGFEILVPGDFGGIVTTNTLDVPTPLYSILYGMRIRTDQSFLGYLEHFPNSMASLLGWQFEQILIAKEIIIYQLDLSIPNSRIIKIEDN